MTEFLLRTWEASDAASIAKHANNEKVARNLRDVFPHPYTFEDAQAYVDSCIVAGCERQIAPCH